MDKEKISSTHKIFKTLDEQLEILKSKGLIISFEMFNFICVSLDNLLILSTKLIISLKNSIKIYPFIA